MFLDRSIKYQMTITEEFGEFLIQMLFQILDVETFEISKTHLMKINHNCHDFT